MGFKQQLLQLKSYLPPFLGGTVSPTLYNIRDPRLHNLFHGIGTMDPRTISLQSCTDIAEAWDKCPPIVAIVCGKVLADSNGKVVFKYTGTDELVNLSKQPTARAMNKLMQRPNPLQTWRQFRAQQKAYTQIFGFCPVLTIKPYGMADPQSTKAMWNIPPQYVTIKTTGKVYWQTEAAGIIESIETTVNGVTKPLPVEDIFILKDQYISLYQNIIPKSRMSALEYPISNIIEAYKGANTMIVKRGAMGILSNQSKDSISSLPMQPGEKEILQQEWSRYGLSPEMSQIIITESALTWQQIALPVKDLMLYEAIADGTRSCCSVYGYPYGMFPKDKNDSFHNKAEDKKSLYSDAIIPESDTDMEVYNNFFQLDKAGIVMDQDFSHLDVFQVSAQDEATAKKAEAEGAIIMYTGNLITLRRAREMMGEETTSDDDVYFSDVNQSENNGTATDNAAGNATETGAEADQSGD